MLMLQQNKIRYTGYYVILIWQRSSCPGRSTSTSKWRASPALWHQPCPCPTPGSQMVSITLFSLGVSDKKMSCNNRRITCVIKSEDRLWEDSNVKYVTESQFLLIRTFKAMHSITTSLWFTAKVLNVKVSGDLPALTAPASHSSQQNDIRKWLNCAWKSSMKQTPPAAAWRERFSIY